MFLCRICGKEFESKEKLGGHVSGHSRNGIKRDSHAAQKRYCVFCGKELPVKNKKYCNNKCQALYERKVWESSWLSGEKVVNDTFWISGKIRSYLFRKYGNRCARCGWGEVNPYTNKIPLEVDHIDGDYKNNSPSNLILLCPNCHSLTKTYKGANVGNGRAERREKGE